MAPTTRSRVAPETTRTTKRAAQDWLDEDADDANAPTKEPKPKCRPAVKRAKTTQNETHAKKAPSRRSTTKKAKPTTVTRGGLKALPKLPLDVLKEIFCTLDPASLVNISHTTKSFRQLLLSPACEHVWREAFSRDETGILQPPDGMRAKSWALLLFGRNICEHCYKPKAPKVLFDLRARLCEDCISSTLYQPPNRFFRGVNIQQLIPTECVEIVLSESQRHGVYGRHCLMEWYTYAESYHTFVTGQKAALAKGSDEELQYVREHRAAFAARYMHAVMANEWQREIFAAQKRERERRSRELSDAKGARKQEIERRLKKLGYNTYNKKLMSGVFKLKEWTELWPAIRGVIDGNHSKEYSKAATKHREARICNVGRHYERMLHDSSCVRPQEAQYLPRTRHCLNSEPLKTFVEEDAPDEYNLGWDDTTELDLVLRQTIQGMREAQAGHRLKLYDMLVSDGHISKKTSQEKALSSAKAVFRLGKDWSNELRFGHEVMSLDRMDRRQRYWSMYEDDSPVEVDNEGVAVVRMLQGLLGMTGDATVEDMDAVDAHFVCMSCKPRSAWLELRKADGSHLSYNKQHAATREVLSWREAVVHVDGHKQPSANVRIRLLTKCEQAALEAKYHGKYKVTHKAPICFGCCHCHYGDASQHARGRHDGLMSKRDVIKHLQTKHSTSAKKITENVDFWYHPCFSRGLLDSSITSFELIDD